MRWCSALLSHPQGRIGWSWVAPKVVQEVSHVLRRGMAEAEKPWQVFGSFCQWWRGWPARWLVRGWEEELKMPRGVPGSRTAALDGWPEGLCLGTGISCWIPGSAKGRGGGDDSRYEHDRDPWSRHSLIRCSRMWECSLRATREAPVLYWAERINGWVFCRWFSRLRLMTIRLSSRELGRMSRVQPSGPDLWDAHAESRWVPSQVGQWPCDEHRRISILCLILEKRVLLNLSFFKLWCGSLSP